MNILSLGAILVAMLQLLSDLGIYASQLPDAYVLICLLAVGGILLEGMNKINEKLSLMRDELHFKLDKSDHY